MLGVARHFWLESRSNDDEVKTAAIDSLHARDKLAGTTGSSSGPAVARGEEDRLREWRESGR